uniref:hypothetical protein n=1 Tax=uncultured Fibrobacter sp. TaxID=261512 RepID=UPI002629C41D|nr:hypothetical protein [uncultured Fibrobacter sp.]
MISNLHSTKSVRIVCEPIHHCEICGEIARLTINGNRFCDGCMRSHHVRAFLLGKASK